MVDITLIDKLLSNQFATGLGVTAILGGLMYQLKSLPGHLWNLLLWATTMELSVSDRDQAFVWLDKWLAAQPYTKKAKKVMLKSFDIEGSEGDADRTWILTPGAGQHWFWWRGRILHINRESETSKSEKGGLNLGGSGRRQSLEKLHFRVLGRSQSILRELIEESQATVAQETLVPLMTWRGWWTRIRGRTPRALDTIVLKEGQMQRILDDLAWFEKARDWYVHRGIPYRRGYLFFGPPGTGKTSIVLALAGHLKRPVCVLNIGSIENDDALFEAVTEAPKTAIVLIEDIDCAESSKSREKDEGKKDDDEEKSGSKVTKAGLLNALDGITTPDGRIFIMTTNYPERLDPALVRPGRADVKEYFGYFDPAEQSIMAERFYGKGQFAPLPEPVSPAQMQAAFTMFPGDPVAARKSLEQQV